MKKLIALFAAIVLVSGFTSTVKAQTTATATASSTIIAPISIAQKADMNFGNIAVSASTAGTVILDASSAGTRTTGGAGGVTLPAITGTFAAAKFTVTGSGASTYAFSISPSSLTLTYNTSNHMSVGTFTNNLSSGVGTLSSGTQDVYVGATLIVGAAQPAGLYLSDSPMTATVNYN